ncbi:MAG: hypothetical protein IJ833_05290 [Lachnospiraceae bacterium]|nr:hypothetical protein [Lachnospiraceae bacterium]
MSEWDNLSSTEDVNPYMQQGAQQNTTAFESAKLSHNPYGIAHNGDGFGVKLSTRYPAPGLTKKQFYNHPLQEDIKKRIKSDAIVLYVLAGLNLLILGGMGLLQETPLLIVTNLIAAILVAGFLLGMGLGIHLGQSFVCAILLLVFSIIEMLLSIVLFGRIGGWMFLIVGIEAVMTTNKFRKKWKKYQQTGLME